MIKNNSKHTIIFPEIPVRHTLSDIAEVEPIYTWSMPSMVTADSN